MIEGMQRSEIDRMVSGAGMNPAAFWAVADVSIGDLLGDTGQIDPAKVDTTIAATVENLGLELKGTSAALTQQQAAAEQLASWTADVAKATNVPAELLRGSSVEDLQAHAALLKPYIVASRNGVIPTVGRVPANDPDQPDAFTAAFRAHRLDD